jgi:hypothetical protein
MSPYEKQTKITDYENNINSYQTYDEVLMNYKNVVLLINNDEVKKAEILQITNDRLKQIELNKSGFVYTDVSGNQVNIFEETQILIMAQAIEKKDLSLLLDWYDTYRSLIPVKDSYSIPGSDEEAKAYEVAKVIEKKLLDSAVELNDITIVEEYFEINPYEKLPQNSAESIRNGGWGNAKDTTLAIYKERIDYNNELAIYNEAKSKKNPIIYTSKYPNGNFDASVIQDDKEGRAYSEAIKSIESAKQFLEDYPNSQYEEQVKTYILYEEWFTSETYLNAIKDIPEEMMNSELTVIQGSVSLLKITFKEFFIDKVPLLDCQIKKRGNDIIVILKGTEPKFTFTINMIYSPDYPGLMYIDSIKYTEGLFKREVSQTFQEKMANIDVLKTKYL